MAAKNKTYRVTLDYPDGTAQAWKHCSQVNDDTPVSYVVAGSNILAARFVDSAGKEKDVAGIRACMAEEE